MATRKLTAAAQVRAFLKTNPKAKPTEIAKALNVSTTAVHNTIWRDKTVGVPKRRYKTRAKKNNWETIAMVTTDSPMHITMEEPKADMVNSPPHYKVGGIEVIDFIKAKLTPDEFRGYLQGNILKYSSRVGYKGDASEDVGKLIWYANKLQETFPT
jgi:hypothetical protein